MARPQTGFGQRRDPERMRIRLARAVGLDQLDFLTQWYRHGGGSDQEILETFGITSREYFAHILEILDDECGDLSGTTVAAIRSVARRRLWLAS